MQTLGPLRSVTPLGRLRVQLFGLNSRERFNTEAIAAFEWLLRDYDGKVISNGEEYPAGFDAAVVEIAAGELKLRVIRFRGEYRVDIANRERNLHEWQDVDLVLRSIDSQYVSPRWTNLEELSHNIRDKWIALENSAV
jgi:hypothetical protein